MDSNAAERLRLAIMDVTDTVHLTEQQISILSLDTLKHMALSHEWRGKPVSVQTRTYVIRRLYRMGFFKEGDMVSGKQPASDSL